MARIVIVSNRVPIPKSRVPAAGGLLRFDVVTYLSASQ